MKTMEALLVLKYLSLVSKYDTQKKEGRENKPVTLSNSFFKYRNSMLFYEVTSQIMPGRSRSHEALPHQADKRESTIMTCNPRTALPCIGNDGTESGCRIEVLFLCEFSCL